MEIKLFEIRDRATFIPAFAIRPLPNDEKQFYLLRSAGYGCDPSHKIIIFGALHGGQCEYDPYNWTGSRTMKHAHHYIEEHFDTLNSGDVIDVEYILGETTEPKISQQVEYPLT